MYRFWFLSFCLCSASELWSQCRTSESSPANPLLVQSVTVPQHLLTLNLWVQGKPRAFAVMENLPVNLMDEKLVTECQGQGFCDKTRESLLPDLQLEDFVFDETMRDSFELVSGKEIKQLAKVRRGRLSGILGRPFMQWFQWVFTALEVRLYRDCDPHITLPGENPYYLWTDYYQLPNGGYQFIGDVLYGHIAGPGYYDRNIRLTVRPDHQLYI